MLITMDPKKLNKLSRYMYELFTVNYPQWVELIQNMPDDQEDFKVEIPSPSWVKFPLIIYTSSEEITVGISSFHHHIGFPDVPCSRAFSQAKEMIDGIIESRVLVASEVNHGKLGSSAIVKVSELVEFEINHPSYNRIVGWDKVYLEKDDSFTP
jgi:hypothetical protein